MAMLSPEKLRRLFDRYATGDNDADKCLDRENFEKFVRDYGYTDDDLQKCFDNLDADGSKTISWDECQNILSKTDRSPDERKAEIDEALQLLMNNKKVKVVDKALLRHILTVGKNGIPDAEVDGVIELVFQRYDADSNQELTREELSDVLVGKKCIKKGRNKERKRKDKHRDGRRRGSNSSDSSSSSSDSIKKGRKKGKKRKDKHRDGRRRGSNSSDSSSSSDSSDDEHKKRHQNDVSSEPLTLTTDDAPAPVPEEQSEIATELQNGTSAENDANKGQAMPETENQGELQNGTTAENDANKGQAMQETENQGDVELQPEVGEETQPAEQS